VKNEYDPDRAKQLLDEADFDFGATLKVIVPAGITEREQSAVLIQQYFAAIGVKADVEVLEFNSIADRIGLDSDGDFDLCFMGYTPSVAPNGYQSWFIVATTTTRLEDPAISDSLSKGDSAATEEEARRYYSEYQQLIEEQLPLIFLYGPNNLIAHSKRIGGINYDNFFLVDNIHEWTVE
jgi:peptide/nickel transport system substrate-binding protein